MGVPIFRPCRDFFGQTLFIINSMFELFLQKVAQGQSGIKGFSGEKPVAEKIQIDGQEVLQYTGEFWTSAQRQASSLQEVSYRACFKPQLPEFFIHHLSNEGDTVYDPFSGRGTTALQAALMNRKPISNDINPLNKILTEPRILLPGYEQIFNTLENIPLAENEKAAIDLSMFYHPKTEAELVSLKKYFLQKKAENNLSPADKWIRMVALSRLTGHSKGFFSVYTMPPNQAVSQKRQIKINKKRNQKPEYRDVKALILRKSKSLLKRIKANEAQNLRGNAKHARFFRNDARHTPGIGNESVKLTVTSPPFLNIVQYSDDNWLRAWFIGTDAAALAKKITMAPDIEKWTKVMQAVFYELYRITQAKGFVAFEVGELKKGKLKLEEHVFALGEKAGFETRAILINQQEFTKTSNIWKVENNKKGTNTNRIVLFQK